MSWDLLATPNPSEFAVRVWASGSQVLSKLGGMVAGTTLLKNFEGGSAPSSEGGMGAYVFLKAVGPNDKGEMGFIFGKPKTEAEKYRPYDEYDRTEEYPFYPVVESWRAEPDVTKTILQHDASYGEGFQTKWNVAYRLRETAQGATTITYKLYQAPTKFRLKRPIVQQPVRLPWDLPGDSGDLGKVLLTRRIRVPVKVVGPVISEEMVLGPTVPAGWTKHLIDADQEQDAGTGIWTMIEKYARPPRTQRWVRNR